jgi:hypothetical protein
MTFRATEASYGIDPDASGEKIMWNTAPAPIVGLNAQILTYPIRVDLRNGRVGE